MVDIKPGSGVGGAVIEPGDLTSEVLEAIAVIASRLQGMVFVPAQIGGDVIALRRELVGIFGPLDVEVAHAARYTTDASHGSMLYEGIVFTHRDCMARVKLGFRTYSPPLPGTDREL